MFYIWSLKVDDNLFCSFFRFALKNDLPLLEYCTLPRTGALEVIMQVIGPDQPGLVQQNNSSLKNRSQTELPKKEISKKHVEPNPTIISKPETGKIGTQDSQDVVTNNNQTKWNTEQYFR